MLIFPKKTKFTKNHNTKKQNKKMWTKWILKNHPDRGGNANRFALYQDCYTGLIENN
jgi:hypothetical protein